MNSLPPLTHVALTVRDLSVSIPWYEALFDAEPVIDEDTEPHMHHTVFLLGNGSTWRDRERLRGGVGPTRRGFGSPVTGRAGSRA